MTKTLAHQQSVKMSSRRGTADVESIINATNWDKRSSWVELMKKLAQECDKTTDHPPADGKQTEDR